MQILRPALAIALFSLLAVASLSATAAASNKDGSVLQELPDEVGIECAPPCGYIWPRIGVHSEVQSPFLLSNIRDFPAESEVVVTYSWDMEQEGTGISDPTQEMQIMIVITRTPAFMSAELDRHTCSFTLLPVISEYEVCTLTLSVQLHEEHLPADEDELRETGHRLMLFAASEESGTFMKSYGLEDIRFRFDELPSDVETTGDPGGQEAAESPAPLAGVLLVGLLVGIVALRARRR